MKKLFHLSIAVLITVLFAGTLYSVSAIHLQKTRGGYTAMVKVPDVGIGHLDNGYVGLQIKGYYNNNPVGKPAIPEQMFRLAIGKNKIVPEIKVDVLQIEEIVLSGKLHPMQEDWPCNLPLSERHFSIDLDYYRSSGIKENIVSLSEPFVCHGVPGVEVSIRPVSYNPVNNTITVVKNFKLEIIMPEGLDAIPAITSKSSHAFVKNIFINYDVPLKMDGGNRKEAYLILCESAYEDNAALEEFITFRQQLFDVTKVPLSEAGNSSGDVQSYIRGLDPIPTYVIFVGNPSTMPYFTSGNPSYWQYSLKEESDKYSDIFVGMFSVRDEEGLSNIVRKTIYTEEHIGDYPKNICLYSTYDGDGHIHNQVTYIKERYWDPAEWEIDWQIADNNSSLSVSQATSNAKEAINSNTAKYIIYQGHGSSSGFASGFGKLDLNSFKNTVVYPFIWGFACSTGDFDKSACFGEICITAENAACMYTGASVTSAAYQKILNAGMACAAALKDELKTIGQIFYFGKQFVFDTSISASGFSTSNKTGGAQMYNLFGDPALAAKSSPTPIISKGEKTLVNNALSLYFITPTKIILNIPTNGKYNLALFSVDGRKIHEIVSGENLTAGKHTIKWDSNKLSHGVYFARLNGKRYKTVSKFLTIK